MRVTLGRIVGVFGVRGWVKVESETRPRENILGYRHWHLARDGAEWQVDVLEGRPQGKGLVARLAGVDDRNQAEALVGAEIGIAADELPRAGPDEYYWSSLEGLTVVNAAGIELGCVAHLFETGANDVMVVRGEREHLIPFIRDVVQEVNLDEGRIRVDWDEDF